MRVSTHAARQYQSQQRAEQRTAKSGASTPQAKVTTRRYGVRVGSFGLDYVTRTMELDPSLSRAAQERKRKAQAFEAEAEVESLRREVAESAANQRNFSGYTRPGHLVRQAMAAYEGAPRSFPEPGTMLTTVV